MASMASPHRVLGPHCDGCIQQPIGQRRVEPSGTGANGIMLVGDSPWTSEIAAGYGFAGASGAFLDKQLLRLGMRRGDFTITNSIWCKPPHLGWTDKPQRYPEVYSALRQCEPYLDELITARKPKVIVALGGVALRRTCGVTASVESRHSYVHEGIAGIPTIATFHPSGIMQGKQKLTPCLMFALRRAQEIANGTYRESAYRLLLDPSIEDARGYLRDHLRANGDRIELLMVDIETPESADIDEDDLEGAGISYQIIRAGFSLSDDTGISFPWSEPYIQLMQEAIDHADTIAEWADNHFDSKRLSASGLRVGPGRVISGMWAWHFLQSDLLKGLAFVAPFYYCGPPFKHLSHSQPALYNAMDNCVGRAATVGSIDGLKREGRYDRWMRHCVDADRILVRMGGAGVNIDQQQQSAFMGRLKGEMEAGIAALQPLVPDSVKPLSQWKKPPRDMTGVLPIADAPSPMDPEMIKGMMRTVEAAKETVTAAQYKSARAKVNELRNPFIFQRREPFNPNSRLQLISLMRHLKIKPPVKHGELGADDSETTGAKHLLKFGKKHPIFKSILYCKQRGKLLSTYNWPLDAEGKIMTVYGFHPSTWRKSSRHVNLQNIPKRNELANEFRRMIIAPPGFYFVESDASAIEAVLVGYDAGSPGYITLSKAGLHGWMTAAYHKEVIPLDLPFAAMTKLCKAAKKMWPVDYEVMKRVDHLSNYLGSPARIYEEYPEEFESESQAAMLQQFYFSTAPGREVRKWQQKVLVEAHDKRYLINHFGYKHYFYSVFKWDSRKRMDVYDDDAKRAVAFRPQSDGSACQTEVLLRMAEGYEGMVDRLRLIIHDSIVTLAKEDEVEEVATIQHREMVRGVPELEGLSIGAETKYGRNLAPFDYAGEGTNADGMREMMVEEVTT